MLFPLEGHGFDSGTGVTIALMGGGGVFIHSARRISFKIDPNPAIKTLVTPLSLDEKSICQRSAESRGFSPGTSVSSHRES